MAGRRLAARAASRRSPLGVLRLAALDAGRPAAVVARLAWDVVALAASAAVRAVVVAARFAVLFVLSFSFRAEVTVPFAPDLTAFAVLTAPREAVRVVPLTPEFALERVRDPVRAVLLVVASPFRLASCVFSMTASAASSMLVRTF